MSPKLKFEFVVQSLDERELSKDTRTKIRRQAMRAVVHARKQSLREPKPASRKKSTSSEEVDEEGTDDVGSISLTKPQKTPNPAKRSRKSSAEPSLNCPLQQPSSSADQGGLPPWDDLISGSQGPRLMPFDGIDVLVNEFGISPQDLSSLSTIHHAVVVTDILRTNPRGARDFFFQRGERDMTFFAHVGQRYGRSVCLDAALRCLFSKAKSLLSPHEAIPEAAIFNQYGQAIACLQAAVNSPSWSDPEVLCATALLAIFELFNFNNSQFWSQHIAGAARLIQSRGPKTFKTAFEKKIFLALFSSITCECFVHARPCFLGEEAWQEVFDDVFDSPDPLSDTGYLAKEHGTGMAKIPAVESRVFAAVAHDLEPTSAEIMILVDELQQMHRQCQRWRTEFTTYLASYGKMALKTFDTSLSLFCGGMIRNVLVCMFLAIVDPDNRQALLDEAVERAQEVIEAHRELPPIPDRTSLFMGHRDRISEGTVIIAPLWRESIGSGGLIEMWRVMAWCKAMQKTEHPIEAKQGTEEGMSTDETLPLPGNCAALVKMGFELLNLD